MSVENSESIEQLAERISNDLQHCHTLIAASRAREQEPWRILAGSSWEDMLQSREATENYLFHNEPKLRLVALHVLRAHWKAKPDDTTFHERLALEDPDRQVRGVALLFLSSCYGNSNDARIGRFFANTVGDQSQTEDTRFIAYVCLHELRGLPGSRWPKKKTFQFPRDIDWAFVNSFLGGE